MSKNNYLNSFVGIIRNRFKLSKMLGIKFNGVVKNNNKNENIDQNDVDYSAKFWEKQTEPKLSQKSDEFYRTKLINSGEIFKKKKEDL